MKGFWKVAAKSLRIFSSTDNVSQHLGSHQVLAILKIISVLTTVFASLPASGTMAYHSSRTAHERDVLLSQSNVPHLYICQLQTRKVAEGINPPPAQKRWKTERVFTSENAFLHQLQNHKEIGISFTTFFGDQANCCAGYEKV